MDNKKLILLELNEVNFDVVKRYIEIGEFPSLRKLMSFGVVKTLAEGEYKNLEPWIQWPSAHTGMDYSEHQIFRLGDVIDFKGEQIFEEVEKLGYRVGCVSPMNVANNLNEPEYFIPDPWTQTPSDTSWWSKCLSAAISQAVNDNSKKKLNWESLMVLTFALLRFASFKHYALYLKYALTAKWHPWRRSLFLDLLLHDIHAALFARGRVNFSTLFLNACAHIQHHYFFNSPYAAEFNDGKKLKNPNWYLSSSADPLKEVLKLYDLILKKYLDIKGIDLIVATGLSQIPYGSLKFYYRLRSHEAFLKLIGLTFDHVTSLMTRDFVIHFASEAQAEIAYKRLVNINIRGVNFFGDIDNRGLSVFVSLTYPHEIKEADILTANESLISIYSHVSFVAIKNGMHQSTGFLFFSKNLDKIKPKNNEHIKILYDSIIRYFK